MTAIKKIRTNKIKTVSAILLLALLLVFPLVAVTACAPQPENQEPVEIATRSLDEVIQTAMEQSPECRHQVTVAFAGS